MISEAKRSYMKAYLKAYRETHRERLAAQDREFYLKNRPAIIARSRKWYDENRQRNRETFLAWSARPDVKKRLKMGQRDWHLRNAHGIGEDGYDEMFASQGGRCAICSKTSDRRFHVDHSHITGRLRGLLCAGCNRSIAIFDSPLLDRASAYARGW